MRCPALKDLPPPRHKSGWPWTVESPQLPAIMPEGKSWPRLSIVTSNYNYAQFMEATIRSVLLQGYPNLEYIIIDGSSTDNSVEIIKRYERWLTYWVSEKDKGQSEAINKGFSQARGDIFAWLNSDDIYLPAALKTVAEYAMRFPDAQAFVGGGRRVDINGKIIRVNIPADVTFEGILNNRAHISQASSFFSRRIFQECGRLDERLHIPLDLDLWLRIAQKSYFVKITEVLSQDLEHKEAKSVADKYIIQHIAEKILVLARYDEERAKEEIIDLLRFYKQVSRIPFYSFLRFVYKKLPRKNKRDI